MIEPVVQVIGSAALAAIVAGAVAAGLLHLLRRAPVLVHIVVIVVAAVGAVAGGIAIAALGMFISSADTAVALGVTATSGVISVVMAALLGLRLSTDARALGRDARRLGAGETVVPARRATTELDAVQAELVESSERLRGAREHSDRLEHARRELVSRIAHDLLAPLASIRAIAESLEDGLAPEPERAAGQLGAQTVRLQSLVGDLFELSRIDAGTMTVAVETVSLSDLASDVVAQFGELAHRHGRELHVAVANEVLGLADPRAFSRALVNVIVNALEHSPNGGRVVVTVTQDAHAGILLVSDDGPGVADDDRERIFEAGWRASHERASPAIGLAGGAGLGLAITRAILEAHGGSARLVSESGSGAVVELRLPRAMPSAIHS